LPPITIEHRGFDNFMVVLDWIRKNFEAPNNLLVAGVSAGGYGATANSAWVARAFRRHTCRWWLTQARV
jgi:acetyl esterase/lipase